LNVYDDMITIGVVIKPQGRKGEVLVQPLSDRPDRFQSLRRARTRKIQLSAWVTSGLLHLPEGPALQARNAKVARFPDDFGWIHAYDVQQALGSAGVPAAVGQSR